MNVIKIDKDANFAQMVEKWEWLGFIFHAIMPFGETFIS